jgi:hypothetical protein
MNEQNSMLDHVMSSKCLLVSQEWEANECSPSPPASPQSTNGARLLDEQVLCCSACSLESKGAQGAQKAYADWVTLGSLLSTNTTLVHHQIALRGQFHVTSLLLLLAFHLLKCLPHIQAQTFELPLGLTPNPERFITL